MKAGSKPCSKISPNVLLSVPKLLLLGSIIASDETQNLTNAV